MHRRLTDLGWRRPLLVGTNITDNRYQLDSSNTFGGTHWADPRMIGPQVRYKFHY